MTKIFINNATFSFLLQFQQVFYLKYDDISFWFIEIDQMCEQCNFYILNSWQSKKNTKIENPGAAKEKND